MFFFGNSFRIVSARLCIYPRKNLLHSAGINKEVEDELIFNLFRSLIKLTLVRVVSPGWEVVRLAPRDGVDTAVRTTQDKELTGAVSPDRQVGFPVTVVIVLGSKVCAG